LWLKNPALRSEIASSLVRTLNAAVFAIALVLPFSLAKAARDPLSEASIALRCEGAGVLIIGVNVEDDRLAKLGREGVARLTELGLHPALSPGQKTLEITQEVVHTLTPKRKAGFQIGARWQIYPGAGLPTAVVVEKLILLYGNGNKYIGALGHILNSDVANRIAGLAAAEYLAIPGAVLPGVSQIPMIRLDQQDDRVTKLLFDRGRGVIRDGLLQLGNTSDPEEAKRIQEMNNAFLMRDEHDFYPSEIRTWRWAPGGGKPLLLVEAVWSDGDRRLPLFAMDGVVQYDGEPRILSFDYRKAEWMRAGEFRGCCGRLDLDRPAFLNAWKIGSEYFLLTYLAGYEGYSVDLQKVDSAKGLQPVFGFGDGS
jgi:hypothetical protein